MKELIYKECILLLCLLYHRHSQSSTLSIIYVLEQLPSLSSSFAPFRTSSHLFPPPRNYIKMLGCIFLILRLIRMDQRREERRAQEAQAAQAAAQGYPVAQVGQGYPVAQGYPAAPVAQVDPQPYDPAKEPQAHIVSA
jgi:hypothetical protein